MTYVNHIPRGEGWETLSELGQVFPDFSWRHGQQRSAALSAIHWMTALDLPEYRGRLRVTITNKLHKTDRRPLLSMELTARGLPDDRSREAVREWFERSHAVMVRTFVEMTAAEVRVRVWGQQG